MTKRKETPDVLDDILGAADFAAGRSSSGADELSALPPKATRTQRPAAAAPKTIAPRPAASRKWEYALISFQNHHGWRPRYRDGDEMPDWSAGPLIHEYLAQLAGEGWELVTASSGQPMYGLSDVHQLYFRRPKAG